MQEIEAKQKKAGENLDRLIVQQSAIEDVIMTLAKSHVISFSRTRNWPTRKNAFIVFFEKYINRHNGDEPPRR